MPQPQEHTQGLDRALDGYSKSARGRLAQDRAGNSRGKRLAGYAAATGAGLAMAGAADAAIVYSGVQNLSVQIDPAAQATTGGIFVNSQSTSIDLDGGGADVKILAGMQAFANNSNSFKYAGVGSLDAEGGALLGSGSLGGLNLNSSAQVGPGGAFSADEAGRAKLLVVTGGATVQDINLGNIADGVSGFVGIRLGSGNYGWIRLLLEDRGANQPFDTITGNNPFTDGLGYADRVTVIDWAYDDSGASIHVGDTESAVPAPAPLALLAVGAAGIGLMRRRRKVVPAA